MNPLASVRPCGEDVPCSARAASCRPTIQPSVPAAAARYGPANGVTFTEASVGGLRLLDVLAGYERVILVDAVQTRGSRPGDVCQLAASDLPT